MQKSKITASYIACKIDISQYFTSDLLKKCGGKIYLSGFFDDNLNTFICSQEKMIFVHTLCYIPEFYSENEIDEIENDLSILDCEDDYFSRSTIEKLRKENPDNFQLIDKNNFNCNENSIDEIRKYLQSNPIF